MIDAVEMAERHGRMLGRLSELGMSLAEGMHAQVATAMEAGDPKAVAELTLTFHRVSRSVRQSIALEAKLVRDAARAEREAPRRGRAQAHRHPARSRRHGPPQGRRARGDRAG
jgi:hypothetical protein